MCKHLVIFVFAALATLKPQAGLVAPQVAPASQPAAVVRVHLEFHQIISMHIFVINLSEIFSSLSCSLVEICVLLGCGRRAHGGQ